MKLLLLLRHAKSSWGNDALADHDRPLNERGRRDAPRMGRLLRTLDLVPDQIVASSATRAATTAQLVAEAAGYPGEIRYTRDLYLADPETYVDVARTTDDAVQRLMLVGHNPDIEELVAELSSIEERMSTATLACVRLPIAAWRELKLTGHYELTGIWRPKEIRD
ncbi:histidine phosphatase family protein [Promineifilum sp.]|uniref:SixA phosphatase family protein n=1 Tax=Promineifilum sp. TaxID=2664178 RepID=UPI0035B25503